MKRLPYVLIALMALSTACLGWYAHKQQQELDRLRSTTLSAAERDTWQKRVWDLEKRLSAMDGSKSATIVNPAAGDVADASDRLGDGQGPGRGRRGEGGPIDMFMNLSNTPEFQKLMTTQQRGMIDSRYAALFKSMALSPSDLQKFQNLLTDKQSAVFDVLAAARAQGLTGRDSQGQVRQMVQSAQAEVDQTIQQLLGPQQYAQYQNYEATQPQRNTVDLLDKRLSYTQTPLTDQQSQQLVNILASSNLQSGGSAGGAGAAGVAFAARAGFGGGTGGAAPITNQALQQAQGILAGPQLDVLQQMQKEQQAAQQLARLIRNPNPPPAPSSAPSAPKGNP